MATTPPPPSTLRIPPTPRHGAGYDQYEPYSTRYSTRLASQRASRESHTTPPPSFATAHTKPGLRSTKKQSSDEFEALSPPGSVFGSPRKKHSGRMRTSAVTHSLEDHHVSDSADPFTTAELSHAQQRPLQKYRPTMTDGMLPTPAKTPRKKAVGAVGDTARIPFPVAQSSASSRSKKTKKDTAYSLDSFIDHATRGSSQIEIYTDSRDRIPEIDESEGNPFYKKDDNQESTSHVSARASRRSRREEMKRDQEVDEAVKRKDGMVYVFRGKKMFRKFTEDVESDGEDENDLGLLAARPDLIDSSITTAVRPLTRSSIKPRVLFPSANDRGRPEHNMSDSDEEAATDIDEHMLHKELEDDGDQATDVEMPQRPVTPPLKSTVATSPSPGATVRSLRPRGKREGAEHTETPNAPETTTKRVSPFAGWLRKKQTPANAVSKAKKRDADAAASPGGPAMKKTRGNRATPTL
ncbi:uncharacterized protein P174DRAFT_462534 [Aspergillus novofumigatus IBT 16806]|uniref:Uncharacterized protein n=1 Tax=Aspergillus novofumigatus (strain IBT 16806) TaxID=1392255 RepID=A0A2I1C321_ASPN1|nr:uncharacterized protein P174DRAFT_462534 [Aspergillus novofumigatus IBT 16806]PKX92047.1 hypothetical protein P174DRAFT_462534 [Aspergillus novofumigatus IBT 16806]